MERFNLVLVLGIMSSFVLGSVGQEHATVTTGRDIVVKPTPPNATPEQMVNVTIECIGSKPKLSYYIKNRINTDRIDFLGKTHHLTEGFYPAEGPTYPLFDEKNQHFHTENVPDPATLHQKFLLHIYGVTHADAGVYNCSLIDGSNQVRSHSAMTLTVLNPVTSLKLELHDTEHNVVAMSTLPISQDQPPVKLTQGQYMVHCTSMGSNPAPVMSFLYNQDQPYVNMQNSEDKSGDRLKYTTSFDINNLQLTASAQEQTLVCASDLKEGNYPTKEAGIRLMVEIDIPIIVCDNMTLQEGNRYQTMNCHVTTEHGGDGLMCDKVAFIISESNEVINIGQEKKTESYDIMEAKCERTNDGLKASLTFYLIRLAHFETMFYIQYGAGESAHRHPFSIGFEPTAGASYICPLSLFATTFVAMLSYLVL